MLPIAGRSLALLALATLLGCATLRPIERGEPFELAPDEGILLVHVASNVPLQSVHISGATQIRDLKPGHNQRLYVISAGNYRWTRLLLGSRLRYQMFSHDYWRFRVEPGRINYPGMLMVHGPRVSFWTADSYVFNLNRSALSYKLLEEEFPNLLERYPIEYTGRGRDDFLIRYSEAQRALRAAEAPGEPADVVAPATESIPEELP
jgi:hypothetical protein